MAYYVLRLSSLHQVYANACYTNFFLINPCIHAGYYGTDQSRKGSKVRN